MLNEDKLLAVARYLEGNMDQQEKEAFEVLLRQDTELQELEANYKDIQQTLKIESGDVKPVVQPTESKGTKVISMKLYLKWAGVAAVLIIGLFVWAPWSSSLYDQYSFSRQMSVAERGADQQDPFAKAAVLYNKGDYAAARKILQQEYMMSPQSPQLAYYFAITLIETGQEYEARTVLINLFNGESAFKYDAAFYVALSFVKQENKVEALEWLAKIPGDNVNYNKAQSLIQKLK